MKIIITVLSFFCFFHVGNCQPKPVVSEIGEWKLEDDLKSRWEFRWDGKLRKTYLGTEMLLTHSYQITTNQPTCPDVQLAVEPNVKYLKTISNKNGSIRCFYIYALNSERLTLMDALSGQIYPFIRVE